MEQQAGALEVGEELVPEPDALAGTLDQARDVDNRQLTAVRRLDDAEHGRDRREGVVGDLGLRVREPPQERGLAGVGQPGERRVREELQPQLELGLLARKPDLREAGRLPRRRREPRVAAAAHTTAREHDASAGRCQIGHQSSFAVEHLGTDWEPQLGHVPVGPVLTLTATVPAPACLEPRTRAKRREIAEVRVRDCDDVAAASSVAAVRSSLRHVLLASEAQPPVAAPARLHVDASVVVEGR